MVWLFYIYTRINLAVICFTANLCNDCRTISQNDFNLVRRNLASSSQSFLYVLQQENPTMPFHSFIQSSSTALLLGCRELGVGLHRGQVAQFITGPRPSILYQNKALCLYQYKWKPLQQSLKLQHEESQM